MSASWIHKLNESNSKLHKQDVLTQALEAATLGNPDLDFPRPETHEPAIIIINVMLFLLIIFPGTTV